MAEAAKAKTRRAGKPRPLFVVMQIVDGDGNPMQINKDQVKIVTASRDAANVLDVMETGEHKGAFYKRVLVT